MSHISETLSEPALGMNALFDDLYSQLKGMARRELHRASGNTLNTTALVHELYLKLSSGKEPHFTNPAQFFGYAAVAMRHILIDRAYRRVRIKVGGGGVHVPLTDPAVDLAAQLPDLALELDAALNHLAQEDERAAKVVELHFFAGLPLETIAELFGFSRRTVDRDWRFARAFLSSHMQ